MRERLGRYRLDRILGRGGMGVVYAAYDDRLERRVAVKVIRAEALADLHARERFGREAKAAARVNHPNICTLYEYDEQDGQPYLVMELLDGESLAARLTRGPLPVAEALATADAMLSALGALHASGILHRDLKPANVFLTPHGVKLLDFGLAQPLPHAVATGDIPLTVEGMLVGTPQYLAPELIAGGSADERSDIFAATLVVYEMLAGRPAFTGRTLPELVHAITLGEPPALAGSDDLVALDGVLRQGMTKDRAARLARTDELRTRLHDALIRPVAAAGPPGRPVTRFIALPFKLLRTDADTDFLAFSLPDAVSVTLASLDSVVVRSSQAAATTDIRAIGRDLGVDVVLTGTILRAGPLVRVAAQLSDAVSGTLIWSETAQAPVADLFQLQDSLTQRIVSSLAPSLSAGQRRVLERQTPVSPEAYELYLRANQLMTDSKHWNEARSLYERAIALDPHYAPAWARLGRARRVIAKWYGGADSAGMLGLAQAAFQRARQLDPDLAIADDLSAYAEAELGHAMEAMVTLLERLSSHPTSVGLLAGLITTCRYAGLLDASLAAHAHAVAIDGAAATSVSWTHFMRGDYERAQATDIGSPPFCAVLSRIAHGRLNASEFYAIEDHGGDRSRLAIGAYRHIIEGRHAVALDILEQLRAIGFADPEGWYLYAFIFAKAGAVDPALDLLQRSIDGGYASLHPITTRPEWTTLNGRPAFDALVQRATAMVGAAHRRFTDTNGPALLGLTGAASPA